LSSSSDGKYFPKSDDSRHRPGGSLSRAVVISITSMFLPLVYKLLISTLEVEKALSKFT